MPKTKTKTTKKKLFYKIGLGLGVTTAVVAPLASAISCDSSVSKLTTMGSKWAFDSHRTIQEVLALPSGVSEYERIGDIEFNTPLSYGTNTATSSQENAEVLSLFRQVKNKTDSPIFKDGKVVGVDVNRWSLTRFELAEAVTIVTNSGETHVFDNDALTDDEAKNGWHLKDADDLQPVAWERSINYKKPNSKLPFIAELAKTTGIKEITFKLRDTSGKHWIQQTTGQPGAEINPVQDLRQGMELSLYSYDKSRQRHSGLDQTTFNVIADELNKTAKPIVGGSAQDIIKQVSGDSSQSYFETAKNIYGIHIDNLWNENANKKLFDESNKTLTLNFDSTNDSDVLNSQKNLMKTIFFAGVFAPAVSKDQTQKLQDKYGPQLVEGLKQLVDSNKITKEALDKFLDSPLWKSGYLATQVAKRNEFYVGGSYYVSKSEEKLLAFEQNPEYIDERFLNQKNSKGQFTTVKRYQFKFIQESDLSKATVYSEFQQGTSAFANIDPLKAVSGDFLKAISNPSPAGLIFNKGYTANKILQSDYETQLLIPLYGGEKNENVYFNNNYAKLMWGKTLPELRSSQDKPGEVVKSLFEGTGLVFRTNLDAAINAYSMVQQYSKGTLQEWTTWFAPEGAIDNIGTFPTQAIYEETPEDTRKILDPILSKWAASGNLDSSGAINFDEVKRNDYINAATSLGKDNPLGPITEKVEIIKANIKKALDDAGIPEGQKVTWEFTTGRGADGKNYYQLYDSLFKFLRSLDSRLNPVALVEPIKVNAPVNSAANDGNEVKVIQADPDANTTLAKTLAGNSYPEFYYRIFAAKTSYNAGSLKLGDLSYSEDTPAFPMTATLSYQQSGTLLGLSYYADEGKSLLGSTPYVEGQPDQLGSLSILTDTLKSRFKEFTDNVTVDDFIGSKKSSKADDFLNAIKTIKFENIWKSKVYDIATYDYLGWYGLDLLRDTKHEIESKDTKTEDEELQLKEIETIQSNLINSKIFHNLELYLENEIQDLPTQDIVNLMADFRKISPVSMNQLITPLGNREGIILGLRKSWYLVATADNAGTPSIARSFVDLDDVDGDGYGDLPEVVY